MQPCTSHHTDAVHVLMHNQHNQKCRSLSTTHLDIVLSCLNHFIKGVHVMCVHVACVLYKKAR